VILDCLRHHLLQEIMWEAELDAARVIQSLLLIRAELELQAAQIVVELGSGLRTD
jgi:hypothetical protein